MFSYISSIFSCRSQLNVDNEVIEIIEGASNTKQFGGKTYDLIKLNDFTPLLFQWFVDPKINSFPDNTIPILNTKEHPYLDNLKKAALIEYNRVICLFMGGEITQSQKNELQKLENSFSNIKVIFCNEIDFSEFDVKLLDIYDKSIIQSAEDYWLKEKLIKERQELIDSSHSETLLSVNNKIKGHNWFDLYRNLLLIKGCSIFSELKKIGCCDIDPSLGFIYLDFDMVLNNQIKDIYLPDGIGIFVHEDNDSKLSLENGIIAVNRSYHPVLLAGLKILQSNIGAHPYYDGVNKALKSHFDYYRNPDYDEFAKFIKFDDRSLSTDTSKLTFSSWSKR